MKTVRYLLTGLLLTMAVCIQAKDYKLASPNGKLSVTVDHGVTISVSHQGCNVVTAKAALGDMSGKVLGFHTTRQQQETIVSPFYRQPQFTTTYRQADVMLAGGFGMQVEGTVDVELPVGHRLAGEAVHQVDADVADAGVTQCADGL